MESSNFKASRNSCLSSPGIPFVFGQGDVGQLGLGEDVLEKSRATKLPGFDDVIDVKAGGMHSILLTNGGKITTFGCNDEGALGRDTSVENSEMSPASVELPGKVIQVSAGDSHSAALLQDGRVFAWGSFRDAHGNMGLSSKGNEKYPIELSPPDVKIVQIASGADHLILLSDKGQIYTCGCGEQGQLGRIPKRSADRHNRFGIDTLLKPTIVKFRNTMFFNNIWAGSYCTFAQTNKDEVYVFGLNNYHQIGLEEEIPYYQPKISKTFGDKGLVKINGGQHHTLALSQKGYVYAIGRKEYGRLGLGPKCSDATELVEIESLSKEKCVDIATGTAQSFAVTESGQLFAWGMGTNGQLGTGKEDDVEVPTLVEGKQLQGHNVRAASGGGQHTLVLATPKMTIDEA